MVDYASSTPGPVSLAVTRTSTSGAIPAMTTATSTWQRIVIAGVTNLMQLSAQRAYVSQFFPTSVTAVRPRGVEGLLYPAQG